MIFKGNISCYILLLKYPLTLEKTKFIAGEISLIVSLVFISSHKALRTLIRAKMRGTFFIPILVIIHINYQYFLYSSLYVVPK